MAVQAEVSRLIGRYGYRSLIGIDTLDVARIYRRNYVVVDLTGGNRAIRERSARSRS